MKRAGGPSGISASTLKGSGLSNRSGGRGGLQGIDSGQREGPVKALRRPCANSGIWLALGTRRRTAGAPKRLTRRSIRVSGAVFPLASVRAVCAGQSGSVTRAVNAIRSTPKPRSRVSILSSTRRKRWVGSREGALNPASITVDEPSARAIQRAMRRQPRSARASLRQSSAARCASPANTPSWVMRGSGKGSLAAKSGEGKRGTRGSPRRPNAWSRRSRTASAVSFE